VILGQQGGPSWPSDFAAGARRFQRAKWCVPGLLEVANGWIFSSVKNIRACSSLSSAETPRTCWRLRHCP
jgi:hypothetical protein